MAQEQLEIEAQDALDELWAEGRLPFKLTSYRITRVSDAAHDYTIELLDRETPVIIVRWSPAFGLFKAAVRDAVDYWAQTEN